MSVSTSENGLAVAAVDFVGSRRRSWARSESEWSPQDPQQVQRPAQRQRRASWGGRGGFGSWRVQKGEVTTDSAENHERLLQATICQ